MTKISRVKRSFIIVFLVAFIVSLCMGGLLIKRTNSVSANAGDDKTYTVKELFTVDEWVTISEPKKVGTTLESDCFQQGSVFQSERPYKGEIVPTFTGDASLVFKFIHPNAGVGENSYYTSNNFRVDNNGDFKFIITDLTDESNYFIVHYTSEGNVQIEYPNEDGDLVVYGKHAVYPRFNNLSENVNMFSLEWAGENNDELNVIVSCDYYSKALLLLGCFNNVTIPKKMNFPNGYKISFSSDWETGTNIAFKTVIGTSLRDKTKFALTDLKGNDKSVDESWKQNTDFVFSGETVTLPAEGLSETVTYGGMVLNGDSVIKIPQYEDSVDFYTAWNFNGLILPKEAISTSVGFDTKIIGTRGSITVDYDGGRTYDAIVVEPMKPTVKIVEVKPTDGFVNKEIVLPEWKTEEGNTREVSYTVNGEKTTVIDNTFVPTVAGTYEIEYFAKNEHGVTNSETFKVTVIVDIEKPVISVEYTDRGVLKGTVVEVPTATVTDNADEEISVVRQVHLNGEEIPIVDNKFTATKLGDYILSYTSTDNAGNTERISYTISSLDDDDLLTVYTQNFVSVENAAVKVGASGLSVSSTTAYTGKFNAIFEDDKYLTFKFSGKSTANLNRGDGNGDFYFQIADASNPEDYFTVHYGGSNTMGVYVIYQGQKRYCDSNGVPKAGMLERNDEWLTHTNMLGFKSDNKTHHNKLGLVWQDGVLSVIVNCEDSVASSAAIERTIAKFDGSNEVSESKFGLPKLDWSAYTISFGSNYEESDDGDKGSDISFLGINGETDFFQRDKFVCTLEKEKLIYKGSFVSVDSTINVTQNEGLDTFYAVGYYEGLTVIGKGLVIDGTAPTEKGLHDISISIGSCRFVYTVDIRDEFIIPFVQLKNGVSNLITVQADSEFTVSANDVSAYDNSCGNLDATAISIFVKKEGAQNFEAYTLAYKFNEVGRYIVRYVARDSSLNEGYVERTINVVEKVVAPIIVNGSIDEIGYLKHTLQLPTASMGGVAVSVYVTCDGEIVALNGNSLSFTKEGIYKVVYKAEVDGVVAVKEYRITVVEDMEAPTITVNLSNKTLLKGTEIVLPNATATDNVDGETVVSYQVTFGTKSVTVSDNKFTLDEIGAYTITYTSVDIAGKVATRQFIIHSVEQLPADTPQSATPNVSDEDKGGCSCNGTIADSMPGILLCVVGVAVMLVIRKKRKA